MKYHVQWTDSADQDLAQLWLLSKDRTLTSAIARFLQSLLEINPLQQGESRQSSVHRVVYSHPVGLVFEVIEDDKRVIVHGVFSLDPESL